jgi:hypothetical protein
MKYYTGLQNLWHQFQIIRISEGKAPDYNMTFVWALTTKTFSTYVMDWRSGTLVSKAKLVLALGAIASVPVLIVFFTARTILRFLH